MFDDYINRFKRKTEIEKSSTSKIGDIIAQSLSKMDVLVNDSTLAIPVAFINKDRESGNEAVMYTYVTDGVTIGDLVNVFDRVYLVYKEIKNIKREEYINKFNLAECNIKLIVNDIEYRAVFKGPARSRYSTEENLSDNFGVMSSAEATMMFPNVGQYAINLKPNDYFETEGQSWRLTSVDKLTSPGIVYAALEEYFPPDVEKISSNEVALPIEEPVTNENTLIAGVTQTLSTEQGYFTANKKINILERLSDQVKFIIPFGVEEISIQVKNGGVIITTDYQVRG
jgi:hypothetical protein